LLDIEAIKVSKISRISCQRINRIFKYIRLVILELGEIELEESYFGWMKKGKRCRGAIGKISVFGLLKRIAKFRSINKNTFYLHLKECEFRYNNRKKTCICMH
jgi:transposase-like protein